VLFRATLRLHGERPGDDNVALAERVGALTGLDPSPYVRAARHLRREQSLAAGDAVAVSGSYLAGIERLRDHLDGFTPAR
jgi:hypothetical protein